MFSMQGCGAVAGSLVLCILLAVQRAGTPDCGAPDVNEAGYNVPRLVLTWRLLYGLGLLPIAYTLIYRIFVVRGIWSTGWKSKHGLRGMTVKCLLGVGAWCQGTVSGHGAGHGTGHSAAYADRTRVAACRCL